ncbi:MAG TPA: hypothetical protein VG406_07245 [Isosphaeraceae bacterium]|jgi:plastocyanin|nr:hypothetical protein [Isosphaeraceae bacterium]
MHQGSLFIACSTVGVAGVVALVGFGRGPAVAAPAEPVPAPSPSPAAQEKYGTIKGRLVWKGEELPKPEVLVSKGDPKAKDPEICAKEPIVSRALVVDPKTKGVRNGFVYLINVKGTNPEALKAVTDKAGPVEIDQKNCEFLPHAVAIYKGQKLVFKSSDPVNHNVHLNGFNNQLNQAVTSGGKLEIPKPVAERLPMKVSCDIHSWMSCWVGIFDNPFFALTKEDGTFEIKGVPAGAQRIVIWQERTALLSKGTARTGQPITVEAGKTTDLGDIVITPDKLKK